MKNAINRVLNYALYMSLCLMVGTGLLLAFRLPPGRSGGRGLSMLGLDRHEWGSVHLWISYGFVVLVLLHLIIHRVWLIKIAARNRPWPVWVGLAVGVAAILFFLIFPIESRFPR